MKNLSKTVSSTNGTRMNRLTEHNDIGLLDIVFDLFPTILTNKITTTANSSTNGTYYPYVGDSGTKFGNSVHTTDWILKPYIPEVVTDFKHLTFSFGDQFPRIDAFYDSENRKFTIQAAIAGIPKEDVEVTYDSKYLHFKYEAKKTVNESKVKYLHQEMTKSSFYRKIAIPETVDIDSITSSYKDGIIEIQFAIKESAIPRRLQF